MTTPCEIDEQGLDALCDALKRRPRPLALLGAGASMDSGYPDWGRLLAMLEQRVQGKIGPRYQSYLRTLNDPPWQAEEYRRAMGENLFRGTIASEFAPRGPVGPVARAIVRLGFRHFLTTNYDSCIELALEAEGVPHRAVAWSDTDEIREFFRALTRDEPPPYVVHLHGCYYDPGNVVLTESSYAERYVRSNDAARKLFAILITQPVVFVGFSVSDPDLNQLMREANASLGAGIPHHMALVGYEVEEQKELVRNRFQGKFGITPVFYQITRNPDGSENHGCLLQLLSRIHSEVHGAPLPVEAAAPPHTLPLAAPPAGHTPDPLDPHKGCWGGSANRNGRRLRVENPERHGEWYGFDLVVEATEGAPPLEGSVTFHLHQTFNVPVRTVPVADGRARLHIQNAYGVFTVGAVADGGETKLELDLATVEAFPDWFRAR